MEGRGEYIVKVLLVMYLNGGTRIWLRNNTNHHWYYTTPLWRPVFVCDRDIYMLLSLNGVFDLLMYQ